MNKDKTGRRAKGDGSIWRGKDGFWHGAIRRIGQKPRYVRARTQRDVTVKLRALISTLDRTGELPAIGSRTVDNILQQWLEAKTNVSRVRPTTLRSYRLSVGRYLSPRIGRLRLRELTPARLTGLYAALAEDGTPSATVKRTHEVLRNALGYAVRAGLMDANPCNRAEVPTHERKPIRPLTLEQVQALLNAARSDSLEALYALAVGTGMRFGELMGLQWGDINYAERIITIARAVQEAGGKPVIGLPKSAASRRRVHLPQFCIDALRRHPRRLSPWVFSSENPSMPLQRSNVVRRSFKKLLARAGLPSIRFHDLRHSHATLMLASGANVKVLADRLGHSDPALTLRVYAHAFESDQREAVNRLDRHLRSRTEGAS